MNVTSEDLKYATKDPGAYTKFRGQRNSKSAYLFTICAWYAHERTKDPKILREAENVLNALLLDPAMEGVYKSNIGNIRYYLRPLPEHPVLKLLPECNISAGYKDPLWKSLNPFFIPTEDEKHPLRIGLRVTDFDKKDHGYFSRHGGPIRNYYEMDGRIIADKTEYPRFPSAYSNGVKGLEDIRMCSTPGGYRGFAVTADAHEERGPRLSLLTFDPEEHAFKDLRPLRGPGVNNKNAQKNWLPYWEEDQLKAISSSDPLTIARISEDGICETIVETQHRIPGARGGAPPILWDVGANGQKTWIYAVHHVKVDTKERFYYHRFVKMQDNRITAVSRLFYLNDIGIEYISGIFVHPDKPDILYIGYGWRDVEARLTSLSRQEVEELFEPMPFPGEKAKEKSEKARGKEPEVDLPGVVQFIPIESTPSAPAASSSSLASSSSTSSFIPIDLVGEDSSGFIPI